MKSSDAGLGKSRLVMQWRRLDNKEAPSRQKKLMAGETLIIGRDPDCNVILDDKAVSRRHVKLEISDGSIRVHNLSRSRTTEIEKRLVAKSEWRPGERLTINPFEFTLHVAPEIMQSARARASRQAAPPELRLLWHNTRGGEPTNPKYMALQRGTSITIGKELDCDVVLVDPLVSRKHVRLEIGKDGVHVFDLGSTNGIVLGNEQIKQALWRSGQILEVGSHIFSIQALNPQNDFDRIVTAASPGQPPMGATTASAWRMRVFISYSRKDLDLANKLETALHRSGFFVWIDRRIPYGEEWKRDIIASIESSDIVVFLVSPESIASDWCKWELEQVLEHGKRLFPIRIRDIPLERLPRAIRDIQILPRIGLFGFDKDLPELVKSLQADQSWTREHTRLLVQAIAWRKKGRPNAMLLRGVELKHALVWVKSRPRKATIAPQISVYIECSRKRQRVRIIAVSAMVLVSVIVVGLGIWKYKSLGELASAQIAALRSLWTREAASKDKEFDRLRDRIARLERFRSEFYGRLSERLGGLGVREVGDRFVVPAGVLFGSGQAHLTTEGRDALSRIPSLIRALEIDRTVDDIDWVLQVNGHTDKRPIATSQFPSNLELSTARATSVVKHLLELRVSKERLVAAGYGDTQLLDKGESEESHQRNRRIELKLTDR